jgi:hypothetical protein
MKNYKGYYIDKIMFNSEAEIDKFLEDQAVLKFKQLNKYFAEHASMEAAQVCEEQAKVLHNKFGYSWERIEQLEIEAIA